MIRSEFVLTCDLYDQETFTSGPTMRRCRQAARDFGWRRVVAADGYKDICPECITHHDRKWSEAVLRTGEAVR